MEDSKLNPEEQNPNVSSSPEIKEDNKNEENVQAFTEFLENASNQDVSTGKTESNSSKGKILTDNSIFRKLLDNGIDGISTDPNYKMLALLIILLINLSAFFVIGNIGKAFLRNAGIMS